MHPVLFRLYPDEKSAKKEMVWVWGMGIGYIWPTQTMIFRSKPPDIKPDPSGSHEIEVIESVWSSSVRIQTPVF